MAGRARHPARHALRPATAAAALVRLALWFYGIMAVGSLGWLWWSDGLGALTPSPAAPLGRLGIAADLAGNVGLGLLLGWAVVVASQRILARAPWARYLEERLKDVLDGLTGRQAVLLALTSGVGEELLFRGVLLPVLSRNVGWPAGLLLSSMVFAGAHLSPDRRLFGWAVFSFGMGLGLGGLQLLTGCLWAPATLHFTVNGLNLQSEVWQRRLRPPAPRSLSGERGPDSLGTAARAGVP